MGAVRLMLISSASTGHQPRGLQQTTVVLCVCYGPVAYHMVPTIGPVPALQQHIVCACVQVMPIWMNTSIAIFKDTEASQVRG